MSKQFKPRYLKFSELSHMLGEYEARYGFSTIELFERYASGNLGDDDDLMMWVGLYHLYLTSHPVRQFMHTEVAAAT